MYSLPRYAVDLLNDEYQNLLLNIIGIGVLRAIHQADKDTRPMTRCIFHSVFTRTTHGMSACNLIGSSLVA